MILDYCYINPVKVDSLFSQINGYIVNEKTERKEKGVKGLGKVGLEIGNILAKLGVGKGSGDIELSTDYSRILEVSTSLSVENKLDVILVYHKKIKSLSQIEILHKGTTVIAKTQKAIQDSDIQEISGFFYAVIPGLNKDEVTDAFLEAYHYQWDIRSGNNQPSPVHREATLVSEIVVSKSRRPLMTVPLFLEYIIPNQFFEVHAAKGVPLKTIGNSIFDHDQIIMNPIAISIEYNKIKR